VWCEENPLTSGYLVDVAIETIQGKPVLYKILNVHSRVEYPSQSFIDYSKTIQSSLTPKLPEK
jgi:hypothetical protein